jgi:predicted amidophosphoribosyltransferase
VYRSASDGSVVPSNELIYKLKRSYRKDLIDFVADELARSVIAEIPDYDEFAITSVPRSKKRVRKYGYDHAQKVACALAQRLGIKYVKVLESKQLRAQKLSEGREARIANAKFDYCGNKTVPPKVFVFDDVVTSGASMGNCATLLRGIGAKTVVGICMGIAFKDKYVPFVSDR